jgi:hypothetical protein
MCVPKTKMAVNNFWLIISKKHSYCQKFLRMLNCIIQLEYKFLNYFFSVKKKTNVNCTPKSGHGVKTRLELKDDFGIAPESSFLNPIDISYCYSIPYRY